MFVIKRNQVIISALVVMIAVAGYLNYVDTTDKTGTETIALTEEGEVSALVRDNATGQEVAVVNTTTDAMGNIEVVEGEIGISVTSLDGVPASIDTANAVAVDAAANGGAAAETGTEPGTAVFVNSSNDSSYFIQAKLNREQARSSQKSSLTDIINNTNIEKDQKAVSAEQLLEIQSRIEKETAAEALIESKGFDEVYVRISDDSVDVVVNKSALSDSEIAQIEDIVKRKTGFTVEQIYINPLKQ